jgi:hypothetical protein
MFGAGDYAPSMDFYKTHLSRALLDSVVSPPTVIELLMPFFREGLDKRPTLDGSIGNASYIAADLGIAFSLVGNHEAAARVKVVSIELDLFRKDPKNLAIDLKNYSRTLLKQNKLALSLRALILAQELHSEVKNEEGVTASYLDLGSLFAEEGRWREAELALETFCNRPSLGKKLPLGIAETVVCWLHFRQGHLAVEEVEGASKAALRGNNLLALAGVFELRAEFALKEGAVQRAAEAAEQAIQLRRKSGAQDWYARGCLTRALALKGNYDEAKSLIAGIPLWHAAEVYLESRDIKKAARHALNAYTEAWADGPPHSHYWELERSQQLLTRLGVAKPELPPFDPAKVEPIPYEAEIRAVIEGLKAENAGKKSADDPATPNDDQP